MIYSYKKIFGKGNYMNLKTAICDDDRNDISRLEEILLQYSFAQDIDISFDEYYDGDSLVKAYDHPGLYNVLFVDIEMPGTNGIKAVSKIRNNIDRNLITVFVSNYPAYMCESLTVHPYQFLQKPLSPPEVENVMSDIIADIAADEPHFVITDNSGDDYMVQPKDIRYIESVNSRTRDLSIYLYDSQINTKSTLKNMEEMIDSPDFFRCSRTLLVNLRHIHYIKEQIVYFDNNLSVELSHSNSNLLKKMYIKQEMGNRRI
jgi:two-component system response regulator LytT